MVSRFCCRCGKENDTSIGHGKSYCKECLAVSWPEVKRKSKLTYVWLGLLFGGLGVHNFYARRNNCAIGQLITTLLVGWLIVPLICVWVEVIRQVCYVRQDGDGVPFI